MKKILILADGFDAEVFLKRISRKDATGNTYLVVSPSELLDVVGNHKHIELMQFDPTSSLRISRVFYAHSIQSVFVLMQTPEETRACIDNVRRVDANIEIVILDAWGSFGVMEDKAAHVINLAELAANRLYEYLPNVPSVAQNIGLSQGEIMEVFVPYGSSFAYRHIGSIPQTKWKIAAIYRDNKQILPTNATMIHPQDTLLILGRPQVLGNIYRRISKKDDLFPEPFGQHLYLIVDMQIEPDKILGHIEETKYLLKKLQRSRLIIRIINPGDMESLHEIKSYSDDQIDVLVQYGDAEVSAIIWDDTTKYNIGLILTDTKFCTTHKVLEEALDIKKLLLLFGNNQITDVDKSIVLVSRDKEMESISSTYFYISETLGLAPMLCYYDPDGDFATHARTIEHYEALSKIFQYPIKIDKQAINPIKALEKMNHVLQVVPMTEELTRNSMFGIFSTKISDHILDAGHNPTLLIPAQ